MWAGVADKKTVMSVVYKLRDTGQVWAKRFIVEQFILDKSYRYIDESADLQWISSDPDPVVLLHFAPGARQKVKKLEVSLKEIPVKKAQTRGTRISNQKVKKVEPL